MAEVLAKRLGRKKIALAIPVTTGRGLIHCLPHTCQKLPHQRRSWTGGQRALSALTPTLAQDCEGPQLFLHRVPLITKPEIPLTPAPCYRGTSRGSEPRPRPSTAPLLWAALLSPLLHRHHLLLRQYLCNIFDASWDNPAEGRNPEALVLSPGSTSNWLHEFEQHWDLPFLTSDTLVKGGKHPDFSTMTMGKKCLSRF